MKEVLIWDNFYSKETFKSAPYFMLNEDLKNNKIEIAKTNIKEFVIAYIYDKPMCGTNKESFKGINEDFSFWHYHVEPYNLNSMSYYGGKKCFDKKSFRIDEKKLCNECINLNHKLGRESGHVIYYIKFHKTQEIGIVGYGTEHIPFPKVSDKTIQAVLGAKRENFQKIKKL